MQAVAGLVVAVGSVLACWDELQALAAEHLDEVGAWPGRSLNLDRDAYARAEQSGRLVFITARDDQTLVGYACFVIGPNHHTGLIQATQDAVYLRPECRLGQAGSDLISECDRILADLGVVRVFHFVSEHRDFSPVLLRQGYHKHEVVYAKDLTDG